MQTISPLCACNCGQPVRIARFPSQRQSRFLKGHQHKGANNGHWRGGKEQRACAVCGAAFYDWPSQVGVTCGKDECYRKWQGLVSAARGQTRQRVQCLYCGNTLWKFPSQVKKANFCNRFCQGAWRGENYVGPSGTNWRGGGRNFFHSQTRIRDGHRCVVCGFDLCTDVHHVTPIAAGGINDFSNLVTVCPNHHRLAHIGVISLEAYRRMDWQPEQTAHLGQLSRVAPANRSRNES